MLDGVTIAVVAVEDTGVDITEVEIEVDTIIMVEVSMVTMIETNDPHITTINRTEEVTEEVDIEEVVVQERAVAKVGIVLYKCRKRLVQCDKLIRYAYSVLVYKHEYANKFI